jgi:cobalt-zinc-cadmium efflux system membrane fusion protein
MIKRILFSVVLVAVGAVGFYLVDRWLTAPTTPASAEMPVETAQTPAPASGRTLTLSEEAVTRAGITVAVVGQSAVGATRRLPGVVEPHGYRVVDVTPLMSGSVIEVRAELGQVIRQGAVVARLRSPELTDQVRGWLTTRAERDVVAQRFARTESLAKIGAASRQDLEEDQASLVRVRTELDTARLRLERLGVSEARLAAMGQGDSLPEVFDVLAQAGGVVTARMVNPGQNVDVGEPMLTVADRSRVWIIADVFEADLGRVREGQQARVTSETFATRTWTGRVAYLDPAIARDTRTAKVRVEVENPDEALRFGMFVTVELNVAAGASDLVVPRAAVQSLGPVDVVFVEQASGQFVERVVQLGAAIGDSVVVTRGLAPGDRVATSGSFALRAERDRLGWPPPAPLVAPVDAARVPTGSEKQPSAVTRVIEITATGLIPPRVSVPANQIVDLVFIRRVDQTCGTEVDIPSLKIRRALPLNERVTIRLSPQPPGELSFSCGMDMLKGVIIVGR